MKKKIARALLIYFLGWIGSVIINRTSLKPAGWASRSWLICLVPFYGIFAIVGAFTFNPDKEKNLGYVKDGIVKSGNEVLTKDVKIIKKDRLRFTKNSASSTLCYLAILFNVLYFVEIYSTNSQFYYNMEMGFSVVYNLLFLLFTFLCSEGVKNYSKGYSIFVIIIGCMQFVRILGIPMSAFATSGVMSITQFILVCTYLVVSAVFCIIAGIIGWSKYATLKKYKKETGLS